MNKIVVLFFILISTLSFSQSEFNYSVLNIPAELRENANSVLLDEYTEVDVSEEKKMVITSHTAITILNKKGDRYAYPVVHYDAYSKAKDAEVYVYDASGKEIQHYKKRDFRDVSAVSGGTLYSNSRALFLDYNPASYPYTLVFDYKTETSSTAFVDDWYPLSGYVSSTKKSVYKIIFNPNNKPRYRATNIEGFNISVSENPNEFIFKAENLKAIKYEELSSSIENIAPKVSFALDRFYLKGVTASVKSWEEFGTWMQNSILYDVADLPEGTKEMAKSLVKGETSNEAKARIIYQYVQDKVRYISVSIGIGGWKPMLASEVDKLSYGDCKALTNYTKALLDAVGVPSYYTILFSGSNGKDILDDFPTMQGDHVILGIPEGDVIVWLECTSQDAPFGFNGSFSDDRDVLIVTTEGGKIVHTKVYSDEENLQEYRASVRIDNEGGITGFLEGKYEGLQYDGKYMWDKATDEEKQSAYKEKWDYINGISIESINLNDNKADIVFTEKLNIQASNYATKIGDDLLLCANVFNQSQYIPSRISNRKQELFIGEGYKDIDHLDIVLPEGYKVESLPENTTLESKFGKYSISFKELAENKLEYKRTLIIKKGSYPAEDYKAYRSFRKRIAKLDKSKILLNLKTQ
jgi:transglutaminase-like putative cysteine protease